MCRQCVTIALLAAFVRIADSDCSDWWRCPAPAGLSGGAGTAALFTSPAAAAVNPSGTLFATFFGDYVIADSGTNTIRTATGALSSAASSIDVFSGGRNGSAPGFNDNCGIPSATYNSPRGLVYTGANSLWVSDYGNNVLRRIFLSTSAVPPFYTSTVAAKAGGGAAGGTAAGFADGSGTAAQFSGPWGLAYAAATSSIFVADSGNSVVRRVGETSFRVTTVAGAAGAPGWADGAGAAAQFDTPTGLAFAGRTGAAAAFSPAPADGNGTLYVADRGNALVRRVMPGSGEVTTWLGALFGGGVAPAGPPATATGCAGGTGTAARLGGPAGLALSGEPALYVADAFCNVIWRVTADATATVFAGQWQGPPPNAGRLDGVGVFLPPGGAGGALFNAPTGLMVSAAAPYALLVADTGSNLLRSLAVSSAAVKTYAGPAPPSSSPSASTSLTATPSPSPSPSLSPSASPGSASRPAVATPSSTASAARASASPAAPMAVAAAPAAGLALGLGLGLGLGLSLAALAAAAVALAARRRRGKRRRPAGLMSRFMAEAASKAAAGEPPPQITYASPGGGLLRMNPLLDMFARDGAGFQMCAPPPPRAPAAVGYEDRNLP